MYRLLLPLILYSIISIIVVLIVRFLPEGSWDKAKRIGALVFVLLVFMDQVLYRFFDIEVARVLVDIMSSLKKR